MLIVFVLIASLAGYTNIGHANEDIAFYKAYRTAKKQPKTFYKITPPSTLDAPVAENADAPTPSVQLELINLNMATIESLQRLPYIGLKRAEAIIEYRDQLPNARFTSIEQLLEIKGMSTKLVERIRAYIVI